MAKYVGKMHKHLFLKNIRQISNHSFEILWNDSSITTHRLSTLQQACPCAKCKDTSSHSKQIDNNVRARSLKSVGRYAIRIEFTSGCSAGIYDFDLIRAHKENE